MSDNINALSGSMNDQVAPSEADMAQRLQSSQTNPQSNSTNAYNDALTRGFDNTLGTNRAQNKPELEQVVKDRAAD